jgi:hypothetical protein
MAKKKPEPVGVCRKIRKSVMDETLDYLKKLREELSQQPKAAAV